MLQDKYSF